MRKKLAVRPSTLPSRRSKVRSMPAGRLWLILNCWHSCRPKHWMSACLGAGAGMAACTRCRSPWSGSRRFLVRWVLMSLTGLKSRPTGLTSPHSIRRKIIRRDRCMTPFMWRVAAAQHRTCCAPTPARCKFAMRFSMSSVTELVPKPLQRDFFLGICLKSGSLRQAAPTGLIAMPPIRRCFTNARACGWATTSASRT